MDVGVPISTLKVKVLTCMNIDSHLIEISLIMNEYHMDQHEVYGDYTVLKVPLNYNFRRFLTLKKL